MTTPKLENPSSLLDRPIAFHPVFVKLTGSINAALFLSQTLYWSSRCQENGWFYKVWREWEAETGFTRREQEGCRRKLKELGLLEEHRETYPARVWFRLNTDKLNELLAAQAKNSLAPSVHPMYQTVEPIPPTVEPIPPTVEPDAPQSAIFKGTENTTETTTETTHICASGNFEISEETASEEQEPQQAQTILTASQAHPNMFPSPALAKAANRHHHKPRNLVAEFNRFWESLPESERVSRQECIMEWQAQNLDSMADMLIADHAKRLGQDKNWQKYHISVKTYLKYQRWTDAFVPTPESIRFEDDMDFDGFVVKPKGASMRFEDDMVF